LLGDTPIAVAADTLKTQHGVLVLPATVYGYPGSFFRIGFGKEDFDVGLHKFAAYLDTLPGATA
jgi:hypothetical protein